MSARQLAAPVYLLACLLLGGSTQSVWFNAGLQLIAVVLLTWAVVEGARNPIPAAAKRLSLLTLVTLVLLLLTLVPLPPRVWTALPGRAYVSDGLRVLGLSLGWQPTSLSPYDSISTLLPLLPPLGMLAAMIILRAYSRVGIVVALLCGTVLNLLLGVLQVRSPPDTQSRFYLQPEINAGTPSGFFANPNHMATLMLVTLPFAVALLDGRPAAGPRRQARLLFGVGGITMVMIGLFFNGSLAGLCLVVPVGVASALMLLRPPSWAARALTGMAILGLLGIGAVLGSPLGQPFLHGDAVSSVETRRSFAATSMDLVGQYAPVGSGLGTFEKVYRMKEDPRAVDPTVFVNHAHDDYLELAVELGVPGGLLILAFLFWWGMAIRQMLRSPAADAFARAGAIGSAAVLLHSVVDFPLRNSAISTSFAVCLALILISRKSASSPTDLRPARHVEIR